MKNISLGLVILSLLIVSCTTDSIDNTESINGKVSSKKSEKSARLVQNLTPENPANIYDFAGKLHNDILDIYLTGNYQYNTIAQISQQVEAIAAENNDLMLLNLGTNLSINLDVIQEIVNNPQAKLDEAIANSTMTNVAKGSLSSFMNDVLLWKNNSYEEIYQSIISYESSVMTNPEFNNEDKRIILTTSSIVRYSLYYDPPRKDEDWDSSVGHRVGGLSGAIDNSSTAVIRSLVAGIMINNLITE
ncbi:hypothetical protein [Flavobacterium algoritolerans]|uniref:Uncharacterized protein n=1 Tax=Flavobacterium algoritolerans TaxID=3041254 RepID=A0ABT6V9F1_9FLAO|nr:hypothetical protein [Flavobacterium algoritolerans]MDI5894827.1 hypothetical protein [Flavobacterium algoritolerans]